MSVMKTKVETSGRVCTRDTLAPCIGVCSVIANHICPFVHTNTLADSHNGVYNRLQLTEKAIS